MISLIKGTVVEKSEGEIILLLSSGIAFSLHCSINTLSNLPAKTQECTLHTHLHVREDTLELYGFSSLEERYMFRQLISVSGIGPKGALLVLSSMSLSELRLAILTSDAQALSRAPGIGKKTAQRISLELKDKLTKDALSDDNSSILDANDLQQPQTANDHLNEAMQALRSLGYSPQESTQALKGIENKNTTADELIKQALRQMATKG